MSREDRTTIILLFIEVQYPMYIEVRVQTMTIAYIVVVVVYSGVRLELPIPMHTGIIKRNTQCIYR